MRYKRDARIGRNIIGRICVLVKGKEPGAGIHPLQYFAGVSATAKSAIHIHAAGLYIQPFDGFVQQYRHMVARWLTGSWYRCVIVHSPANPFWWSSPFYT